jgi:hypothetical protein
MNVYLTVTAAKQAIWPALAESVWFYLEDVPAINKKDPALLWVRANGKPAKPDQSDAAGFCIFLHEADAQRARDILTSAGLVGKHGLNLHNKPVLPQDDPREKEILERLANPAKAEPNPRQPVVHPPTKTATRYGGVEVKVHKPVAIRPKSD